MEQYNFSNLNRKERIERTLNQDLDLIIIGGGITGAGIAFDAAQRGLRTLLLEKKDFASGTSSKSTKLIHGGLRYLKQLEFGLVRETGLERSIAHHNICHLVHPEKMLLPIVTKGSFSSFTAGIAIDVYDRLANVPKKHRKKKINKAQTLSKAPLLNPAILKSSIEYAEYRTDDARLTMELIKASRLDHNEAFNYMEVTDFTYSESTLNGVECLDKITNKKITFKAKSIISSTGPWVDDLKQKDSSNATKNLFLSKGVHIVISRERFPLDTSIYFDAFDDRMIFAIPRGRAVYIGTTDDPYSGDKDDLRCTHSDAEYLLNTTNNMFPELGLSIHDIESTWTGLRPLILQKGKSATEISRKDEIFISDSGLISIAGGKLTGYRKMAKKIIDLVFEKRKDLDKIKCSTRQLKIHSSPFENYDEYLLYIENACKNNPDLSPELIQHLGSTYGKITGAIIENARSLGTEKNLELNIVESQIRYTLSHESTFHPLDFLDRRTGWLFFDIPKVKKYKNLASSILSKELGLDSTRSTQLIAETDESIDIHTIKYLKSNP